MRHPGVNKIAVPLNIIVCPLQYFQGMLCNDIANYIKKIKINRKIGFFVKKKGHMMRNVTFIFQQQMQG